MAQQTAQVTVGGTPENPVFNFVLPAGAKGEPGGWTTGVALGSADLNTITSPGLYHQSSTSSVQPDKNYPPMVDVNGSVRGILEVQTWAGSSGTIMQRYTRIGTGTTGAQRPRVTYTRFWQTTLAWSDWSIETADQSVADALGFRTQQTWDDATNSWISIAGPGGLNGQSLNQVSLNELFTPGLYHQWSSTYATVDRGYPRAGVSGLLRITPWTGSSGSVMQEFVLMGSGGAASSAQRPRVTYQRYFATQWSDWSVVSPQRVDNTAGRAIYTWDDTANREQIIYGDTGWRNITSLFPTWTSGFLLYRRTLNTVELLFEAVAFSDPIGTVYSFEIPGTSAVLTGNIELPATLTSAPPHILEYSWGGQHKLTKTSVHGMKGFASFPTRSPWPTSLIGTPHA